MTATDHLFERYYFSHSGFVDGTTLFHRLCRAHIEPGGRLLEIGAGPKNPTSAYLSGLGSVVGADVSTEVRLNPNVESAVVYDGMRLPFRDGAFDACVSNYVVEHIRNPENHFREVARVLRRGGCYCFRTPNLWHYVSLLSRMLPYTAHLGLANPARGLAADAHDPYPTVYAANTTRSIERLCRGSRLTVETMLLVEPEPCYGKFHPLAFIPMMAYERLVNRYSFLKNFRVNIFCVASKP